MSVRKTVPVILLLLAMLLTGCFPTETNERTILPVTEQTETEAPTRSVGEKQTFSFSYVQDAGFNPLRCDSLSNRSTFPLLFESLFIVTGDFLPEPVLCEKFYCSADKKSYRFSIFDRITFTDGSPLTAADVVASIQLAQQSPYYSGRLAHIAGVSASGMNDILITLDIAYDNLPLVLDIPILKQSSAQSDMPIGTGPYYLDNTGELSLRRYAGWWQNTAPAIETDRIKLLAAKSANEIRDTFEFGITDFVCTDPNAANAAGYHCNCEVWDCGTTVFQYLGFHLSSPIFYSRTIRSAVTYGIDRAQISQTLMSGYADPAPIPCPQQASCYDATLAEQFDYAPEKLRAVCTNAGLSSNHPGTFLVCSDDPKRVQTAQYISQMLEKSGLYLQVQALDREKYVAALKNGNYDVYYGEVKLPANFDLSCFFHPNGALNFGGIADNTLVESCMNAIENSEKYPDYFSAVMEKAFICPVLFKHYAVYISRGTVSHIEPAIDAALHIPNHRKLSDAAVLPPQG